MSVGRKLSLTVLFLAMAFVVVGGSFYLALQGKLVAEWVQIVNMFLMLAGAATGGFQVANAYITTKVAQSTGTPTPMSSPPAAPVARDIPEA